MTWCVSAKLDPNKELESFINISCFKLYLENYFSHPKISLHKSIKWKDGSGYTLFCGDDKATLLHTVSGHFLVFFFSLTDK